MKALTYSDITLIPSYTDLVSRKEADTSRYLGHKLFALPVMPSNMECVINENIAKFLSENDYFYVMHRFKIDILEFVRKANEQNWRTISISIGVKQSDKNLIENIIACNYHVDYITIDIAHGHSIQMRDMLEFLRQKFNNVFIIAGNIATPEAAHDLSKWGANAIKVGVGPGAACSTAEKTGFHSPMFSTIQEIARYAKCDIIADGGVRSNGDIAKALVAGADWVMAGSLFATCIDSPAAILPDGTKIYYGSASQHCKGHTNNVEGKMIHIVSNGMSYAKKLNEIKQDLQSSITYSGGYSLDAFNFTKWQSLK